MLNYTMNKWFEIFFGLILLVGIVLFTWASPNWGDFWNFRHAAWELLKGSFVWIVTLVGALFIILGINDLKD